MTTSHRRTAVELAALLVLATVYVLQLLSYGPTTDPDPDGYFSYAAHLKETGTLAQHRRLPGYPALLVAIESVGSGDLATDAYRFHVALSAVVFIALLVIVRGLFGAGVAVCFGIIVAAPNFFALLSTVTIADLPSIVLAYLVLGVSIWFLRASYHRAWALVPLVACLALVAQTIHPSSDRRMIAFLAATFCVWFAYQLSGAYGRKDWLRDGRLVKLAALLSIALVVGPTTLRIFAFDVPMPTMDQEVARRSPVNFVRYWQNYRGLLCLPPGQAPSPVDERLEALKNEVSGRLGYRVEETVPPHVYPEFLDFFDREVVSSDAWLDRVRAHPILFLGCALREWRAKYHALLKHLTPVFPDLRHWITVDYPAMTGAERDRLFWRYGLNLFDDVGTTPSSSALWPALREVMRIVVVLGSIVFGIVCLERRFPSFGAIFALATLGWLGAVSLFLPLETRYLAPMLPIIYLAQALTAMVAVNRLLGLYRWLAAMRSRRTAA
jgi:hypothetical protein